MRTIQDIAREAIIVQDACNPLVLTKGFAKAVQELWELMPGPKCMDDLCLHPVFRLWASKMHDLACMGLSDCERYGQAYEECKRLAEPCTAKAVA